MSINWQCLPPGGFEDAHAKTPSDWPDSKYFAYFGSGCKSPMHMFSNFYNAPLELTTVTPAMAKVRPWLAEDLAIMGGELVFPSSEHLWQALKSRDRVTLEAFTTTGRFGSLTPAAFLPFVKKTATAVEQQVEATKKCAYWAKKDMVGILAKLAANSKYARHLGNVVLNYADGEQLSPVLLQEVWLDILRLKFADGTIYCFNLCRTRDDYLLEHDRGAVRGKALWGGCLDKQKDKIVGANRMGIYLMHLRRELLSGPEVWD